MECGRCCSADRVPLFSLRQNKTSWKLTESMVSLVENFTVYPKSSVPVVSPGVKYPNQNEHDITVGTLAVHNTRCIADIPH